MTRQHKTQTQPAQNNQHGKWHCTQVFPKGTTFFFIRFATRLKKEGNDTPEKLPLSLFFPCGNPFSLVSLYLSGSLFFPFIDPYTYVCMYMYIHGRIAYKNCPYHYFFFGKDCGILLWGGEADDDCVSSVWWW